MNKKAIFIPLLLLGIQPTHILSADDDDKEAYEEARAALEQYREHIMKLGELQRVSAYSSHVGFSSNKPELQELIEEFQMTGGDDGIVRFPDGYVNVLRDFYHDFKLRERAVDFKPAKAK